MQEVKQLYLLKEVAQILRVTDRTLYSYVKDGKIKATKIGNRWKIAEEDIKAFIVGSR